jgi:hypothetical protein
MVIASVIGVFQAKKEGILKKRQNSDSLLPPTG